MKRKIEIGKHAGFCGGVNLCIRTLNKEILNGNRIYCLGEIVHNRDVVEDFKNKGVIFVEQLEQVPDKSKLVIRAHGAEKKIYELARNRGMNIIDLTCPKVARIRGEIEQYVDNDDSCIVLIAQKNHPEAKSTISFAGRYSCIVENMDDINEAIKIISNFKTVIIIAQTTFDEHIFLEYADYIKNKLDKDKDVIIKNTICNATSVRQEETRNMAKIKDCMVIIGGKNSSNTKKLYNIAKGVCDSTYLIENEEDLDLNIMKEYKDIGIMAGASTPDSVIQAAEETLKNI